MVASQAFQWYFCLYMMHIWSRIVVRYHLKGKKILQSQGVKNIGFIWKFTIKYNITYISRWKTHAHFYGIFDKFNLLNQFNMINLFISHFNIAWIQLISITFQTSIKNTKKYNLLCDPIKWTLFLTHAYITLQSLFIK